MQRRTEAEILEQLKRRNIALEDYVNGLGDLEKSRYPTTWNAYRLWDEPSLGIFPLGSKSTVNIKNQKEKCRPEFIEELAKGQRLKGAAFNLAKPKVTRGRRLNANERIQSLEKAAVQRQRELDETVARCLQLQVELDAVNARLSAERGKHDATAEELAKLRHQTNKPVKLHSVKGRTTDGQDPSKAP